MTARLFCSHCNKYYEVDLTQIKLMQNHNNEEMLFTHNTYFYDKDICFFKAFNNIQVPTKQH